MSAPAASPSSTLPKHEPPTASSSSSGALPLTPPPSSPESTQPTASRIPTTRVYPYTSYSVTGPAFAKPRQPFSRSARKRDSVLALGAIDHLSHHFTKLSFAAQAERESQVPPPGKRPLTISIAEGEESVSGSRRVELPPTPAKPRASTARAPPIQPRVNVEPDWQGTIADLRAVEDLFWLGEGREPEATAPVDVLEVIHKTTASLRSVRNLVVALPDKHVSDGRSSLCSGTASTSGSLRAASPLPHQNFSSPSRPAFSQTRSVPRSQPSKSFVSSSSLELLGRIRRITLDVLGALRVLEEQYRLPDDGTSDDAEGPDTLAVTSRKSLDSLRSDGSLEGQDDGAHKPWEERLGYLYAPDVTLENSPALLAVRAHVRAYLGEVNEALFAGEGWAGEGGPRRRTSLAWSPPQLELSAADEIVLAAEAAWQDKARETAARLHALVTLLLPRALPPPSTLTPLERFTDGELLCLTFNCAVRRSRRPFGFVPPHKIHSFARAEAGEHAGAANGREAEQGTRREFLFRRIENVREFAAAVKLRYLVPLVPPGTPSPAPGAVVFSAPAVAKREAGWAGMLEELVRAWLDRMADEVREDESEGGSKD